MKCNRCHRCDSCKLRVLVMESYPFLQKAALEKNEWFRLHALKRAMRGVGGGPGFSDDWIFEGAISRHEVSEIINKISETGEININLFFEKCRHYTGPNPKNI
jgi:hypothetical protein